ncbi:hypothetical protein V8G54_033357 [Vigna mungo]|uniref:Uncharacterized protein n=1 Tax=Vigna mungo TaxID=3915 RepID=A0AAQ3MMT5_VIGMU
MLKLELLVLITLIWWSSDNIHAYGAVENIQTNLLSKGCSAYNASNLRSFFANINETFAGLKAQISSDKNKHFAIEDKARGDMRYESERFYDETSEPGGGVSCGNTSSTVTGFKVAAQPVLMELQQATPKIKGFYAATKTPVVGGSAIYAVSQCVETAIKTRGSRKKWGIIGGVVVGAALLLLLLFAWIWFRKSKGVQRGM